MAKDKTTPPANEAWLAKGLNPSPYMERMLQLHQIRMLVNLWYSYKLDTPELVSRIEEILDV